MKLPVRVSSLVALGAMLSVSTSSLSASDQIRSIEEYNSILPYWGVTWSPGKTAVSRYYPSMYTGFVMRTQFPERMHVRTARGNQTRVSVVLDDQTLKDYLYDLVKRYETYKQFTGQNGGKTLVRVPDEANALPQIRYFSDIVESSNYDILGFIERANAGQESSGALYAKALSVLEQLNPGRVFRLNIDLNAEFYKWKDDVRDLLGNRTAASVLTRDSSDTVVALNTLVFGRINYTARPTEAVMSRLIAAADFANVDSEPEAFTRAALELFKAVTGDKYSFTTQDASGRTVNALQCDDVYNCRLVYPEFTTVYPTGSAEAFMSDDFGNRIMSFATPGLWQFLAYNGGGRDFDNIRKEPYYGWAPKMDFEAIGNGFHNPAVSFWGISKDIRQSLGAPAAYTTLNAVKRGGVSHGCLRLPLGHLWELRNIFPVENSKATQVSFFGNASKDFDVYDIDGDGQPEVMGVEYMISYNLKGASGLDRREGKNIDIDADEKLKFYTNLYGSKNVFTYNNGEYVFQNPSVSFPSHLDFKKKSVKTRMKLNGSFKLHEQRYEREKVQFYAPISTDGLTEMSQLPLSKKIVRLMGRIKGCAPTSNKEVCGEAAFDKEAQEVLRMSK